MNSFNRRLVAILSFSSLIVVGAAHAEDWNMAKIENAKMLNHMHHINQAEIQMSQMALDKSSSQALKDCANHMLTDHQNAEAKVSDLAKSMNIALASFQPATHEKVAMDALKSMEGRNFDLAFLDMMQADHQHVYQDFTIARNEAKDAKIKSLLTAWLPIIKNHQSMSAALFKKSSQMAGQTAKNEGAPESIDETQSNQ